VDALSWLAAFATANIVFVLLWPLVLTIGMWIVAARWVNHRLGKRWAIGLGLTVIPVASYVVMFNLTFWAGRGLIWLGLG
jgi:hypothetical protein